ncbi:hypothetical protein N7489_005890 [Penicillium chrysogenum]|uniref:Zn(2)-C6 fungal-type domain-containing protein n=1 Tax=Penicillium chrysogenum TaxID=5076 RepID=A0ABQ8W1X1_PENCH|nr:uncharacterized protein N7489_005890 [Penicillium chrysogenum]KAJ5235799.1 hypothetical protein N7489_005890 [Penicillium chrysogenum]KAJ5254707.1 hypothetical protein N7505_009858 [Penicillium chrysogenum]KAJ6153505.1 hypothetical protein N7497_007824 [Penicillium chrysogenum]
MHTTHNYRHSRRSACDRCRGQKLRCERDHLNGMSCERCLKAQEICTTSMNQPAPIILPSNHGQNLLAREDHQSERFNQRHGSMSVLHKSSAPRVKKIHDPFPNSGRLNMQDHYWGGGGSMPALPGGSLYLPSADIGFNMPLDFGNIISPAEQWCNPHLNWSTDAYNLPPARVPSNQVYPCEANSCFPFTFTSGAPPGASQATEMAISEPFQNRCFNYGDSELPFAIKDRPDPAWDHPDIATINKPPSATTSQEGLPSTNGICKSLLRLKMGLVEDLELFETGSMLLESSSIFYGSSNLSIETLDLPIYRLLNHSSWLLEIVRSSCGTEESLDVTSTQRFGSESSGYDDPLFIPPDAGNSLDEDVATVSPHDSGYHTTTTSPDGTTTPTIPKCDIALWLGILEAHCSLVRIYRAVFMRLYQLFLIIPPTDAATILLLPKVRFGQFSLDGNLIAQVQSLVDFSSTMMGKLDRALKLRSGPAQPQEDREFDSSDTVQEDWSSSIRDIVLAQEQDPCEMSLMEIMECLRQLVKDPVVA